MSFGVKQINKIVRMTACELQPTGLVAEAAFLRRIPYASEGERRIIEVCKPYTQTTQESLFSLIRATKYIHHNSIKGAIVECGVWKGGSIMAMAMALDAYDEANNIKMFMHRVDIQELWS